MLGMYKKIGLEQVSLVPALNKQYYLYLQLQPLFSAKDSQSTHCFCVGLDSCVPIATQSSEQ